MAKIGCLCSMGSGTSGQLLIAFTIHLEYPKRTAILTANFTEKAWRLLAATEIVSNSPLDVIDNDQLASCGMDSVTGTFVVLPRPPKGASSTYRGLQYKLNGGWSSFTIGSTYGWSGQSSVWWPVNEAGLFTFMHAYVDGNGTVHFATLRSGQGELSPQKTWTLNSTLHGTVDDIEYQDGQLILIGSTPASPSMFVITKIPISTSVVPDLTATGINTQIPSGNSQSSLVSALPGGRIYFLNRSKAKTGNSDLHMLDSNSSSPQVATVQWGNFDSLPSDSHYLLTISPDMSSSSPSSAIPPTIIALTPNDFNTYRSLELAPVVNSSVLSWSQVQSMQYFDHFNNQYVSQMPDGWAVAEQSPRDMSTFKTTVGVTSATAFIIVVGTLWWIRRRQRRRKAGRRKLRDEAEVSPFSSFPALSLPQPPYREQVELMEVKGEEGIAPRVPPKDNLDDGHHGNTYGCEVNDIVSVASSHRLPAAMHAAPPEPPFTALPRSLPASFAQPSAPLPVVFSSHPRPNVALTLEEDAPSDDEPVPAYSQAGASQITLNRLSLKK